MFDANDVEEIIYDVVPHHRQNWVRIRVRRIGNSVALNLLF